MRVGTVWDVGAAADSGITGQVSESERVNPRNTRTSPAVPKEQHGFAASSESPLRIMRYPRLRKEGGPAWEYLNYDHVALPALGTLAERTAGKVFVAVAIVFCVTDSALLRHPEQVAAPSELLLVKTPHDPSASRFLQLLAEERVDLFVHWRIALAEVPSRFWLQRPTILLAAGFIGRADHVWWSE